MTRSGAVLAATSDRRCQARRETAIAGIISAVVRRSSLRISGPIRTTAKPAWARPRAAINPAGPVPATRIWRVRAGQGGDLQLGPSLALEWELSPYMAAWPVPSTRRFIPTTPWRTKTAISTISTGRGKPPLRSPAAPLCRQSRCSDWPSGSPGLCRCDRHVGAQRSGRSGASGPGSHLLQSLPVLPLPAFLERFLQLCLAPASSSMARSFQVS